eukprot:1159571-Pelagomonas_calceolata.AAC.10
MDCFVREPFMPMWARTGGSIWFCQTDGQGDVIFKHSSLSKGGSALCKPGPCDFALTALFLVGLQAPPFCMPAGIGQLAQQHRIRCPGKGHSRTCRSLTPCVIEPSSFGA